MCIKLILLFIVTVVIKNVWKINFQYPICVALSFHSNDTRKAVGLTVQPLSTFTFPFTNSKLCGKLHENIQMNHDCVL